MTRARWLLALFGSVTLLLLPAATLAQGEPPWLDALTASDADAGDVGVGGTRRVVVRLVNSHPTERATTDGITIEGRDAAAFEVTDVGKPSTHVWEGGAPREVEVSFTPLQVGEAVATLVVSYSVNRPEGDAPIQTATAALSGRGIEVGPALEARPASLDFGVLAHDASPDWLSVTVVNVSDHVVQLGDVDLTDSRGSRNRDDCYDGGPIALEPGESCVVEVGIIRGPAASPFTRLRIWSDDPRSPLVVPVDATWQDPPPPPPDTDPPPTPDGPTINAMRKAYRDGRHARFTWVFQPVRDVAWYVAQWRAVGGGSWTTVVDKDTTLDDLRFQQRLGATTTTGKRLEMRVRAYDDAGNASTWSEPTRFRVDYDDIARTDAGLSGSWTTRSAIGKAYRDSVVVTGGHHKVVTYAFTGREVTLLGRKGPGGGKLEVYGEDGELVQSVSLDADTTQDLVPLWTWAWAKDGKHTAKVRTVTRSPLGERWVGLDAWVVVTGGSPPVVDEEPEEPDIPDPSISPPIVDTYYLEGVSRVSADGRRLYAWQYYKARGVDEEWQVESRRDGGTFAERLDEHGVQYFPMGRGQARARARDATGWSDWKTIRIDFHRVDASRASSDRTTRQRWTGAWVRKRSTTAVGDTLMVSRTPGARVALTTKARRVVLVGRFVPDGGRIAVYVDGVLQRRVPLTTIRTTETRVVWQRRFSTAKQRTIEIRVLKPSAKGTRVILDSWVIER